MTLQERLNNDLKEALKSGDALRKRTLRQALAALQQTALDKRAAAASRQAPGAEPSAAQLAELERIALTDDDAAAALQKEAKARRESIADAEKAGRPELAAEAQAELALLEAYLPQPLTRDELTALARAAIAEAGVTDPKALGAVMKLLAPRTRGRADGKVVSEVVRGLLGG